MPGRVAMRRSGTRSAGGSPGKSGTFARTQPATTAASTASPAKAVRHPITDASAFPAGTPTANATVIPASTSAMALPRRAGGTMRAAYPASIAHSTPPVAPPASRAAKVSGYTPETAVTALHTAKPRRAPISTGRRRSPRSAAVSGIAARHDAAAYPVTRNPTRLSGTSRPALIGARRPAGSSSVVTAVKAAVNRARRPASGNRAGGAVGMRPC